MEKNEGVFIYHFLTSDCPTGCVCLFKEKKIRSVLMAFLLSLKCPWSIGTLHFYPQLLAIVDENSPGSVCLGLSVMPVGRETPYIPQTNKLGFAALQGYLFLVRLITLVLVSILHQIQIMYFSAASYSFPQLYLYMLFSPYMYFAINT